MKKNTLKIVLAITLFGLALSADAAFPTYTFTDLGTLGGSTSYATAINDVGQVTGEGWTAGDTAHHSILWNSATATDLTPGILGWSSAAHDINNFGQVAGNSTVPFSSSIWAWRASVWNGTSLTVLDTLPDTTHTMANAINNSGQVAGSDIVGSFRGEYHAVVWNGVTPTDLGVGMAYSINDIGQVVGNSGSGYGYATIWNGTTPTTLGLLSGTTSSNAWNINNSGQVIGWSLINNETHATLWNGNAATDFGTNSALKAINNQGNIVGSFNGRATLWSDTTVIDLNTLLDARTSNMGWVITDASGINDNGWIVGTASNSILGISGHSFMMSVAAVPEPDSYAMALMGLGLIGFVVRRRKNEQA